MISQLAHGDRVTAEQAASQWLAAVEKLSAVRWQSVSNMQMTNSNNQMKDKSWQTKQLERWFRSLKMRWRRSTANAPVDVNNSLYIDMLAARKAAKISYARDKRKKQQGDWDTISIPLPVSARKSRGSTPL